jgi:hypothetical protein
MIAEGGAGKRNVTVRMHEGMAAREQMRFLLCCTVAHTRNTARRAETAIAQGNALGRRCQYKLRPA